MPQFPNYYDYLPDGEVGEMPPKEVAAGQGEEGEKAGQRRRRLTTKRRSDTFYMQDNCSQEPGGQPAPMEVWLSKN